MTNFELVIWRKVINFANETPKNDQTMKKYNDGLCSIQEYNQFKTRIFDAVDEWQHGCDADPQIGICVSQRGLKVELCRREEAKEGEWYPLEPLVNAGEAEVSAVLDFTERFCFVG